MTNTYIHTIPLKRNQPSMQTKLSHSSLGQKRHQMSPAIRKRSGWEQVGRQQKPD